MLELTTTFRNLSTAGGKLSAADAAEKAADHLRYIDRATAVEDRASAGLKAGTPAEQRAALRQRFRDAAEKGGKTGSRVAEKIVVSLPNSWPREARREALQRLCDHLAPEGSGAVAYGTTHSDKARNRHLHIIAQDGAESRASALARKAASSSLAAEADAALGAGRGPQRKRVRRQNVIRLGDRDRAKEMRTEIAGILNRIAEENGIERVEHRSFAERGIAHEPTVHEGPRVRAIAEKTGADPSGRINANRRIKSARLRGSTAISGPDLTSLFSGGFDSIDELFPDEPTAPVVPIAPIRPAPETEQARQARRAAERKLLIEAAAARLSASRKPRNRQRGRGFER